MDARRELLGRIAGSNAFQKSNRLRELLLFLGDHSLTEPGNHLREYDIGVAVFQRPMNYDTSQDNIVRVQASQLRKKLQQYYEEEGRGERLHVDLPKGGYALTFQEREGEAAALAAPVTRRPFYVAAGVAAVLLAATVVLAFQNLTLRGRADFGLGPAPHVAALWRQIFGNGQHSYLVVADGNLVIFQDAIKRHISLPDYQNREFRRLAEQYIEDPATRALVLNAVNRNYTSMADAAVLRRFAVLFASNQLSFDVINARETTLNQVTAHSNVILMGSRRANPWVALYEEGLAFQTVFEETPRQVYFVNRKPEAGEKAEYRGQWSRAGYCRVAYLPTTKGGASAVLISGTDIASTEAGGEFLSSETSIRDLRARLGVGEGDPMPYFEVLLETSHSNNTMARYQLVATRRK